MQSSNQPGPGALRYTQYCVLRVHGKSEDQIKAEFEVGSLEALYRTLIQDGYPVCPVCGETPAQPNHCERRTKRRKARNSDSGSVKLPPPRDAIPLFQEVIGSFDKFSYGDLCGYCEELTYLEEELHGEKRFVSAIVDRPENHMALPLRREDFSEEEWRRMCEILGEDPKRKSEISSSDLPFEVEHQGVHRTPDKGLILLIGTYALMRNNLDPLIEKLHPDAGSADREQLESAKEKLRRAAEHLATLIRGGRVGKGAPKGELSRKEAFYADVIASWKDVGLGYEEIRTRLEEDCSYSISREEVERLGGFRLHRSDS